MKKIHYLAALLLGLLAIALGLWSLHVVWVHNQTVAFNLCYAATGPLALILVGWALLHTLHHR